MTRRATGINAPAGLSLVGAFVELYVEQRIVILGKGHRDSGTART